MRINSASTVFGMTTVFGMITVAVVATVPPAQAAEQLDVQSGTTSLKLDSLALNVLRTLGLSLTGAPGTVPPASGFDAGFKILPPSSTTAVVGSSFSFSVDRATNTFSNFAGAIEHSGGLDFTVDEAKLSLLSPLQLGNFSIGFDNGFFLADNLTVGGLVLFDLVPTSAPTLAGSSLTLQTAVKVSAAFNDLLTNAAGVDPGLTGATIGSARIDAEAVPEPMTVAGTFVGGALLALGRRRAKR
jgi:hypothetical protein